MDRSRRIYKVLAAAVVLLALALLIYATKDLLTTILFSSLLAFLLRPVYTRLARRTGVRWLSSIASITLIFLIIALLFFRIVIVLLTELSSLTEYSGEAYVQASMLSRVLEKAAFDVLPAPAASYLVALPELILSWLFARLEDNVSGFARALPTLATQIILAVFFTYYLLIDGEEFIDELISFLPGSPFLDRFLEEIRGIYNTLFNVYFLSCTITGIIASAGYYLLGVPNSLVWGTVTAVFAIIPLAGPILVYVPMSIYYLFLGNIPRGLGILIFGIIALSTISDDVIRPQLAARGGATVHPMITIIAFTAPVITFGAVGLVAGPGLYGFLLAVYRTLRSLHEDKGRPMQAVEGQ